MKSYITQGMRFFAKRIAKSEIRSGNFLWILFWSSATVGTASECSCRLISKNKLVSASGNITSWHDDRFTVTWCLTVETVCSHQLTGWTGQVRCSVTARLTRQIFSSMFTLTLSPSKTRFQHQRAMAEIRLSNCCEKLRFAIFFYLAPFFYFHLSIGDLKIARASTRGHMALQMAIHRTSNPTSSLPTTTWWSFVCIIL